MLQVFLFLRSKRELIGTLQDNHSLRPSLRSHEAYVVNPGYSRALKSSADSATMSFKGVTCVSPSSSSAFVVWKVHKNWMSFVEPGSPRGTFGMPSSAAASTDVMRV